jgi:hypothetical protein
MGKRINTVSDISDDFALETDYHDMQDTLDHIGYDGDANDYGCLFTRINDGEVIEVYGCESNIPYLHYRVDKLR